jgi:hypothetical protein
MVAQQWMYCPTISFTKAGGASYVQQQQQALSCYHKIASQMPSVTKSTPPPTESIALSSRAIDIQCHRCKGFGHVIHDCSSKRVLVIKDDGEYSSACDFDEDTLALLATDHAGNDDHPKEHIGIGDADYYENLIVQCMLSTQMESGAKSVTHIISNKVCHQRMVLSCDH